MEHRLPRVAITQGDTNGVGYEMIFKALADPTVLELFTPIIYGMPAVADQHAQSMELEAHYTVVASASEARDGQVNLVPVGDDAPAVALGRPTEESGEAGLKAIDRALEDYREALVDVLVTAPLQNNAYFHFNGQSRYVEDHLDSDGHGFTILVSGQLRIALATRNLPLKQVMEAISREHVSQMGEALYRSLSRDFRISSPRTAVLALNPKAGDNGQLGTEEQELLQPAINELCEKGLHTFGPYATDTFFGSNDWQAFDGILAMYYDQALTPFRAIACNEGCVYTAGLDLVHTAPLNTHPHDLAGKNETSPVSLLHAIYLAIDIWRNRAGHDEPLANPLKKLYKERKEDGNRSRFNIPKKGGDKTEKGDRNDKTDKAPKGEKAPKA